MSVKTYDAAKVLIIVNGIPIQGYAKGSFLKVSRDSPSFTKKTGSSGETARARTNDDSGTAEITLMATSLSNDALSALRALDEATGDGVGPFLAKDNSGRTIVDSESCWIRKQADYEASDEITDRVWVIDLDNANMFVAGN